ncbi:MAG: Fe-S-containing hydro-lyase [Deltaproteobacteria bacterium]|nr:Fe-S-containing hydro-lyase [Deltaproteobacteria bacterium]
MTADVIRLETPVTEETIRALRAGDRVLISGVMYTARDAAHARMVALIDEGKTNELPFDPDGQIIYFVGPTPTREGRVIGAAGPTTSYRMDAYSPKLIRLGLRGMIGKGDRAPEVRDAMREHGCVYFGATGGTGALISERIVENEIIAYEDLGAEAVRRIVVKDFPVVAVLDAQGGDLYAEGRARWRNQEILNRV